MIQWDKSIQEQFNRVIQHSQGIQNPQTDALFEVWSKRKSAFWMDMGEKLIYEHPTPIVLEMDQSAKDAKIEQLIHWVAHFSESLSDFLAAQVDGIYDNKTVCAWCTDEDDIPVGMKISKAIGRFWRHELNPVQIDTVQCELSRVIQENKVTGRLCLSIHPLDYLSSSENQHNWRSCHALDGEYRAGNLSYMLDQCTVMAYIKSDNDTVLPRFPEDVPWNNKKWRCLFFFDPARGIVYAGRQYPFFSEQALNLVRQCLFEPFNYFMSKRYITYQGLEWKHNVFCGETNIDGQRVYFSEPHICELDTCIPLREWVRDADDSMHFNDLLKSSVYTPWTLRFGNHNTKRTIMQLPPLEVGSSIPCLDCGNIDSSHQICNSDVMVCYDCVLGNSNIEPEWIVHCECCGARIVEEDSACFNDHYYCDDCVDEHTVSCGKCGNHICTLDEAVYEGKDGDYLCWACHYEETHPNEYLW